MAQCGHSPELIRHDAYDILSIFIKNESSIRPSHPQIIIIDITIATAIPSQIHGNKVLKVYGFRYCSLLENKLAIATAPIKQSTRCNS